MRIGARDVMVVRMMQSGGGSDEVGWMKKILSDDRAQPHARGWALRALKRFPTRSHHHPDTIECSLQHPSLIPTFELYPNSRMVETTMRTSLLSLPTELRLQIASYALEQLPTNDKDRGQLLHSFRGSDYKASANLAIRLVCRQFNADFNRLAIQKTTFVLHHAPARKVDTQPNELLRDVRQLVISGHSIISHWQRFPFNRECLRLHDLCFYGTLEIAKYRNDVVRMLRSLQNVKQVTFTMEPSSKAERLGYCRLVGQILKEDHFQRYDSPDAPKPESTWWSWGHHSEQTWECLVAQEPKPIMAERDYMLLMKPKVHELMEQMELVV